MRDTKAEEILPTVQPLDFRCRGRSFGLPETEPNTPTRHAKPSKNTAQLSIQRSPTTAKRMTWFYPCTSTRLGCITSRGLLVGNAPLGVHFIRKIFSGSRAPNASYVREYESWHPRLRIHSGISVAHWGSTPAELTGFYFF